MWLVWSWGGDGQEFFFSLVGTFVDCSRDVRRKVWLNDDVVMKLVFEVLSALAATMAIEHAEYLESRPLLVCQLGRLGSWLDHVEDDGDSVLVGLADSSYICVSCKRFD